jgi:hypothetical protein
MNFRRYALLISIILIALAVAFAQQPRRSWIAGDSHVHSHWSPGYDRAKDPPEAVIGGDGRYSTPMNAEKAREFGLSWMVTTDHGGPNHSKLNLNHAYAELTQSRKAVPEVLQFYGMELNMPAMDHHTLIIPNTPDEWKTLFNIESQFDEKDAWPADPARNSEAAGFKALAYMNAMQKLPLMFANHPSRSAIGIGQYGLDEPREFRNNNDIAPEIYRGMEGAPGHQAGKDRGSYENDKARTLGGFDQMTAIVGGLWDSMLGEGRRFWIVATSDSHVNFADPVKPGNDFWPGQYQKTYVRATRDYEDILDGLRSGRIFAVSGDLIDELDVTADAGASWAGMGETLAATKDADVKVTVRFHDPESKNANNEDPQVKRVDVIVGAVRGPVANRNSDKNETTSVVARLEAKDWHQDGKFKTATVTLPKLDHNIYVRVRGTNGAELEPQMDVHGENPWHDLWFYSNPVFVEVR